MKLNRNIESKASLNSVFVTFMSLLSCLPGVARSLTNAPFEPLKSKDVSYKESRDWLKLRNDEGSALYSILMKTGSPLSATSNYGGSLLYNPYDLQIYQLNFGTYKQPRSVADGPGHALTTIGLGCFLQAGDRGSTLTFGANINYFHLEGITRPRSYVGILPTLGVRIESDAEIILHFEVGKNMNVHNQLAKDLGDSPTDITILNSTKSEASLGLGIGI